MPFLWKFIMLLQIFPTFSGLRLLPTINKFKVSTRLIMNVVEGRRYTSYNIYKGKASAAIKIISPTWTQVPNGNSFTVSKEGGLFFEMAPCTSNVREYDWSKKVNFFMSATECGDLLRKADEGVEFFHDAGAQTGKMGQITKKMKWGQMKDGGLFMSIAVTDKINPEKSSQMTIPVSSGEFTVLDTIIRYSIPKFLGIDQSFGRPGVVSYGGKEEAVPLPNAPPAWLDIKDNN